MEYLLLWVTSVMANANCMYRTVNISLWKDRVLFWFSLYCIQRLIYIVHVHLLNTLCKSSLTISSNFSVFFCLAWTLITRLTLQVDAIHDDEHNWINFYNGRACIWYCIDTETLYKETYAFKSSQHISWMTLDVLWNNEKGEI